MNETYIERISRLKKELATAEIEFVNSNSRPLEVKLADFLHTTFCHNDHVEHCSWEYDSDKIESYTNGRRQHYYDWACRLLTYESYDDVVRVITRIFETQHTPKA